MVYNVWQCALLFGKLARRLSLCVTKITLTASVHVWIYLRAVCFAFASIKFINGAKACTLDLKEPVQSFCWLHFHPVWQQEGEQQMILGVGFKLSSSKAILVCTHTITIAFYSYYLQLLQVYFKFCRLITHLFRSPCDSLKHTTCLQNAPLCGVAITKAAGG